MKNMTQRVVTVAVLSTAFVTTADAQQAVEWRAQDGGNGHWYAFKLYPTVNQSLAQVQVDCARIGAHPATITSFDENEWIKANVVLPNPTGTIWGPAIGARRIDGKWTWVTGEPWVFTAWGPAERTGDGPIVEYWRYGALHWNDRPDFSDKWIIEWSADCNNDGIVDYGQILSGDLVDADSNGVPDSCECLCDVFPDNAVNGIDLGVLLGQWGEVTQYTVTDFNRDGAVDGSDLGQLLAAWGPCPS
jgi:hypothetical protein